MELKKGSKIAVVCRGGFENGPFSAQALATLRKGLLLNELNISGIYAVSSSCPTALLGCIGEDDNLCQIWQDLTPEDIVGDLCAGSKLPPRDGFAVKTKHKIINFSRKAKILNNIRKHGHAFSNAPLLKLIEGHFLPNINRIFSPDAAIMKIGAVDYFTAQKIIFSNRIPEHKDIICAGAIGSMCLIPWFQSPTIDDPLGRKLNGAAYSEFDSLRLMDGAYRAGILLEEAIREPIGYDVIFIIDILGLEFEHIDSQTPNDASKRIQRSISVLTTTNNQLILSLVDRIDEEILIMNKITELKNIADNPVIADRVEKILERMNNGRLRLFDKHAPKRVIISNPGYAIPFDFTNFGKVEMAHLMRAGHHAAFKALKRLGLDTGEITAIIP